MKPGIFPVRSASGAQVHSMRSRTPLHKGHIMTLTELLEQAKHAVVLTGAGISTLSGIPDFRGAGGLYTRKDIDANKLFDLDYFMRDQRYYYEHSRDFLYNLDEKEPNIVHRTLARLEEKGIIHAVITQNIDLLHQKAGSHRVLELHGSPLFHHCLRCGKSWTFEEIAPRVRAGEVPVCDKCGGIVKPDIVFFGEGLPEYALPASPCIRRRPCRKSRSVRAARWPSSTATPRTSTAMPAGLPAI